MLIHKIGKKFLPNSTQMSQDPILNNKFNKLQSNKRKKNYRKKINPKFNDEKNIFIYKIFQKMLMYLFLLQKYLKVKINKIKKYQSFK